MLGNDVWVGDGAVILPGVRIGTGAVIGANAVVTRDVESYGVVGGVPARLLRCRFAPAVVEALLNSSYWDCSIEDINTLPCGNVLEFIERFQEARLASKVYETLAVNRG